MFCVSDVMILAIILKSIPWCHVVVGILFMGSWTRDSPYLPHVDSVASSFRILVTFTIVLEVRGTSFFQLPWTILGRSSFEPKGHDQSALDEFSILYCESSSTLSAWVIRKKCWASLDILTYASTTQKTYVPLSCPSLVVSWPPSIKW